MKQVLGFFGFPAALLFLLPAVARAEPMNEARIERRGASSSVFLYSGAATNAPLLDIIKLKVPQFEPYTAVSAGVSHRLIRSERYMALDAELVLTRYLENPRSYGVGASLMARLIETPWHRTLPGSLGFGAGWSWATRIPEVEAKSIPISARGLFQLQMEFEFDLGRAANDGGAWSVFIRDQHRSGIFGLIDGVVGGSDYICLGVRRWF